MKDARGCVIRVVGADGTSLAHYEYDIWGNQMSDAGDFENLYRYRLEYMDEESGLIYLRVRYMAQAWQVHAGGPRERWGNWYNYCGNDPINRIDITGLEWGYIRDFANHF